MPTYKPTYKTKRQKKNAIDAINSKAFRLFECEAITMAQIDKIQKIMAMAKKKL